MIGAAQGIVKYSKYGKNAFDVFNKYTSITGDLYPKIRSVTKQAFTTLQKRPVVSYSSRALLATPVISGFLPTAASAGTQTVLTINGSSFGTTMGAVNFPNANTGGATYAPALDSQIISWTDTQIQVEVPWFAGTGNIQVENTDGTTSSSSSLTVSYSHLNASTGTIDYSRYLRGSNGNGGFNFMYHTEFDTSSAKTYLEDAFDLWNCESDVNFVMGSVTTTTDVTAEDNINIVRFDNGNELPASTLGRVTTYYLTICSGKAIVKEMDITWNDDANWYYGSGTPSATQHDFKTVALHELGHAHGLGHVIDFNAVMHYGLSVGYSNYNLTQNDIDGAIYNMDVATQSVSCASAMTPQVNCCDAIVVANQPQNENVAENGTTVFTVEATNNTTIQWQVSTNNGTSWSDVNNDTTYSGATTTTLTISNASLSFNGYQYRAYLNNPCDEAVLSNTVTLSVIEYTSIPDSNFEAALSAYDDIPNDGQVPTNNINTLTSLNVNGSNISNLTGISDFTALESLSLNDNSVTSLDLTGISNLTVVAARNNGLTSLDISTHTNMDVLLLENNNLTSLDVSNNINLTRLWAQNNNINALDVSNNPLLRAIGISDSNLTSLDLTQNTALKTLYAGGNTITDLDLSQNTALTIIGVNSNNLSSLNVKNGNNTNVTVFAAGDNPNLTCVLVDDANYSTTNWTSIDVQTSFSDTACSIYTAIPDSNFEAALYDLGYDDIAGDGQVPTVSIASLTSLDVSTKSITDLTGIENFFALTTLQIASNPIATLDLTNNTQLQTLQAAVCDISSLDITGLTRLTSLNLNSNELTSIDLSAFPDLDFVQLRSNNLTEVDIRNGANTNITSVDLRSNDNLTCVSVDDAAYSDANWTFIDAHTNFTATNYCDYTSIPDTNFEAALDDLGYDDISNDGQVPTDLISVVSTLNVSSKSISDLTGIEDFVSLTELRADSNNLSALDLSNNTLIGRLFVSDNNLTSMDLSANTGLRVLTLQNNGLTSLDLSTNTTIGRLFLGGNNLTSLDLRNNIALVVVGVNSNNLSSLNIKNGNNTNITTFAAGDNPNLSCVSVDDVGYSTTNWTNIDAQTSFSAYCNYTAIPDSNFEARLNALGYDDIANDGQVPTALIDRLTSLDVSGGMISGLSGIEAFENLETLDVSDNDLNSIDISSLGQLKNFYANNNAFNTLDLQSNLALERVQVDGNNLTAIDTNNLTQLIELSVASNNLNTIHVSPNTNLESLNINNNSIDESINLDAIVALITLSAQGNQLPSIDLTNNIALETILLSNNSLTSANFRNGNNINITSFDLTGNNGLTCVFVDDGAYSTTNWTNVDAQLTFTGTAYCGYTTIPDSSFEAALESLGYDDISDDGQVPTALIENVTSLDISDRTPKIQDLTGIQDFTALEILNVSDNNLTTIDLSNNLALTVINMGSNDLVTVNIQNGNNTSITSFNANNNPNLTCVLVDDASNVPMEIATNIDAQANFSDISTDCGVPSIVCPSDINVEQGPVCGANLTIPVPAVSDNDLGCVQSDNLEMYAEGQLLGQGGNWDTWTPNTPEQSSNITTEQALSGTKSLKVQGVADGGPEHMVFNLGNRSFGAWEVIFHLYVPSGNTASVNIQKSEALGTEMADFVQFKSNGTGDYGVNGSISSFSYPQDTWFEVKHLINIDGNHSEFFINGQSIINHPFSHSLNGTNGLLTLGAINFYPITNFLDFDPNSNATPLFYVDDISLCPVAVNDFNGSSDASDVYPIGTTDVVWSYTDEGGNVATCTQAITVTDTVAPQVIGCPENMTVCDATVNYEVPLASDNCMVAPDLSGYTYLGNYNNKAYYLSDSESNGSDAFASAEAQNGFMATITSQEHNDWLRNAIKDNGGTTVYIGYTDSAVEGTFEWHSGSTSTYENWNVNEPNDAGAGEDYVEMRSNGVWNDIRSIRLRRFVIEIEGSPMTQIAGLPSGSVFPLGTTTNTFEATDTSGNTVTCSFDVTYDPAGSCAIQVSPKVYLQGAAINPNTGEENLMRDDLRVADLVPITSPYLDGATLVLPLLDVTGDDAIVDWVLVELRDQNDASVVVARQSALLQRDGDVVMTDGVSALQFLVAPDSYYIMVTHRNHLGVLSANTIALSTTMTSLDLTTDTSLIEGGTNAMADIGNGSYAMFAGDQDGNGQIQNTDINTVITTLGGSGYSDADMDMNGQIQNTDINNLMNPNVGKGEQF